MKYAEKEGLDFYAKLWYNIGRKEQWSEIIDRAKIEKAVDSMTLMDDDFMCQVFDENYEGVELVLGIILKQPDIKVSDIRVQHEYRNLKKRSVRLDITAEDSAGRVMDIEV